MVMSIRNCLEQLTKNELYKYAQSWVLVKERIKISYGKTKIISLIMTEARRRKMIRIRPFLAGPSKTADEIRNDVDKIISKR
jgi:hypothetical protein